MNYTIKILTTLLLLSSFAPAQQAPIVRQPPSDSQQQPTQQTDQPYPQQATPPEHGTYVYKSPQYPAAAPDPGPQAPPPEPIPPAQVDQLVNRIALYPDPLLAQTLTAATYWDEIPDAATWSAQHSYLTGDALSQAIAADNLPWDPSVIALLPFPSVLDMMAKDPQWTGQLGNAVLVQRPDVMESVQRLRREAHQYGYLTSNSNVDVVDNGAYVEIEPYNPYLYYVPVYDPFIVFYPPRPGFFVGGAIRFGPVISIGPSFGRYGWFGAGFAWGTHGILIDHRPWDRGYVNRGAYVHPYARPYARPAAPRVENHGPPPRSAPPARGAERGGGGRR